MSAKSMLPLLTLLAVDDDFPEVESRRQTNEDLGVRYADLTEDQKTKLQAEFESNPDLHAYAVAMAVFGPERAINYFFSSDPAYLSTEGLEDDFEG